MAEDASNFLHKLVPNFIKERGGQPKVEVRPMTPQEEFNELVGIYRNMPWYTEHGTRLFLPEHSEFQALYTDPSLIDHRRQQLFKTYLTEVRPKEDYRRALEEFEKEKPVLEQVLVRVNELQKRWGQDPIQNISCLLIWYGPGAWYDPDKKASILRTDAKGKFYYRRPAQVTSHETVHLMAEWLVQKYGLDQKNKERIVDDICINYFSDILPGYVRRIDNPKPEESLWIDGYVSSKEAIENLPNVLGQSTKKI